jgi:phosphoribosylanthranilate isomerase
MTWIKICGTTNLEDAQMCVEAGADALGFIFAESPRHVGPSTAASIIAKLPEKIEKVGVFVLPEVDSKQISKLEDAYAAMLGVGEDVGLTALQFYSRVLHSAWQARLAKQFKIIQAFSFGSGDMPLGRKQDLYAFLSDAGAEGYAFLSDSGAPGRQGGTGIVLDWESPEVKAFQKAQQTLGSRHIVAGGLTAENVGDAVRLMHPFGVDVVTGVEREPGKKDPNKVKAFVEAVRRADQELASR